ncbi:hypothetical protein SCG7109_AU_00090 [Chlamydiales bacterium SCGC AG-110-M15]|nr:hypothetical protein SCG7109_AU_00090 [Chlamydiales bacterium SCGC AG-110-M15]
MDRGAKSKNLSEKTHNQNLAFKLRKEYFLILTFSDL